MLGKQTATGHLDSYHGSCCLGTATTKKGLNPSECKRIAQAQEHITELLSTLLLR